MAKKVKKQNKSEVVEPEVIEEEVTEEEGAAVADNTPRCRDCGKPLTDPDSIAAGIGPECAQKDRGAIQERKSAITLDALPEEGYIPIKAAMDAAAKIGLPRNAAFTAAGRHAGASPVRNESWEPIFVKNRMYVPVEALEDLEAMLEEYQEAKEARKAARKASKKKKAAKASAEGDEDEFGFLSGSIADLRKHLAGSDYTSEQLSAILEVEKAGKNRNGAVKALTNARDERASLEAIEVKQPRKVKAKKVAPPPAEEEESEGAISVLDDLLG